MTTKIWLCLLSHESSSGALQNVHTPLSIGFIGAYLLNKINDIELSLYKRPSLLSSALSKYTPDVIMFGNYMWNENLNIFYAKEIKKRNPDTLIIFGGPNLSLDEANKEKFLKENSFIDLVVDGDGEILSQIIIEEYLNNSKDIEKLKYLKLSNTFAYDHEKNQFLVGESQDTRIGLDGDSLDHIPSPYVVGLMDPFLEHGAVVLMESNRGCPYHCTYCQQSTAYFKKLRYFTSSRIESELEYVSKKIISQNLMISIVEFADPNFGMYKEDHPVFLAIRSNQEKNGFPSQVWCSTGKSQAQRVIDHAKMLKKGSIMIRAAVQSMNESTLKSVKRKNLPVDVLKSFSSDGVEAYSDVMLGLPGETLISYMEGFYELIDRNIDEFSMPTTLLLKGTPLETDSEKLTWGLKGKYRVIPECTNIYKVFDTAQRVSEFECMVFQTDALSFEDYLNARKFNLIVMIFHNTRLLHPIYRYLDFIKVRRSLILRTIVDLVDDYEDLLALFSSFMDDVSGELFDSPQEFDDRLDITKLTANKVFKYLSIALTKHQESILKLVGVSVKSIDEIPESHSTFLTKVINELFIADYVEVTGESTSIPIPKDMVQYMGSNDILIGLSEFQTDRLDFLLKQYPDRDVRTNNMAYHLRSSNMLKTMRFA